MVKPCIIPRAIRLALNLIASPLNSFIGTVFPAIIFALTSMSWRPSLPLAMTNWHQKPPP
jgi:hypothetical protein